MKRTVTRAETRFYCHTVTSCHTKQFDHCKDIWAGTQHSPGLCFEHNWQFRTPIKPWKKYFFYTANYIVGIIITRYGIKPNPHKVQVLTTAAKPTSREDFLLFLKMIQPHSTFIPGLNTKTKHIKKVAKKHDCFHWSQEYQKEFNGLKKSIIKENISVQYSGNLVTQRFSSGPNSWLISDQCHIIAGDLEGTASLLGGPVAHLLKYFWFLLLQVLQNDYF